MYKGYTIQNVSTPEVPHPRIGKPNSLFFPPGFILFSKFNLFSYLFLIKSRWTNQPSTLAFYLYLIIILTLSLSLSSLFKFSLLFHFINYIFIKNWSFIIFIFYLSTLLLWSSILSFPSIICINLIVYNKKIRTSFLCVTFFYISANVSSTLLTSSGLQIVMSQIFFLSSIPLWKPSEET